MIEIRNLVKEYRSKTGTVVGVDNVSLQIEKGDIYGIIGRSGAGKAPCSAASICWSSRHRAASSSTASI